jgi:protein tyrosine phosphatase (PTP) superfamily phosphohydrolase (DUF442 family)
MTMFDPVSITNWLRLDDRITSSGQPREEELAEIRALGVSHIINLGPHDHERALPDEAASVAALGMAYVYIPVDFATPAEQDYVRFVDVMARLADRTIHVHCIANMRVSAFLYRWRRDVLGIAETEARSAMERIWQPGGSWAAFIGDAASEPLPHRVAGRAF